MKQLKWLIKEEFRSWQRSKLAVFCFAIFALLVVITSLLTGARIDHQRHQLQHHQGQAEETFLAQPDRHPHRMVHYGHYVFRTPAILAVFDPGVDSVTGNSIFLEGHRQNSAMFADIGASANLGGLSSVTPASVYLLYAPLLIIIIGYASIVRERENSTLQMLLSQGVSVGTVVIGKGLALLLFAIVLLLPMLALCLFSLIEGESIVSVSTLLFIYAVYLGFWVCLTLLISLWASTKANALVLLLASWLLISLVIPALAVNVAANSVPIAGKIETDFIMNEDLKKLGDGHNAKSKAFDELREKLLKQYKVDKVEDLPVNFRGVVAGYAEQKLTDTLNQYAEKRMGQELQQSQKLNQFAWFSPALALSSASQRIAGSDIGHHHEFLRKAEALRIDFVQGLNKLHAEELKYQDDINRGKSAEAERRSRVSSEFWSVLGKFKFEVASARQRIATASSSIIILSVWLLLLLVVLVLQVRRFKLWA